MKMEAQKNKDLSLVASIRKPFGSSTLIVECFITRDTLASACSEKGATPDMRVSLNGMPEDCTDSELYLLAWSCGLMAASICNADSIQVDGVFPPERENALILEWILHTVLGARWLASGQNTTNRWLPVKLPLNLRNRSFRQKPAYGNGALLLFSGGADSLWSALELKHQGIPLALLHVEGLNVDAKQEALAARVLAKKIGLELINLTVEVEGIHRLSGKYGEGLFAVFPTHNSIPFGRDLLLITLGAIFAHRRGLSKVFAAHEYDNWMRTPTYVGPYKLFRTELASAGAREALNEIIKQFVSPAIDYDSPIGHLTKYGIIQRLAHSASELLGQTSFCYWGNMCGRCSKCLTYSLLLQDHPECQFDFAEDPMVEFGQMGDIFGISSGKMPFAMISPAETPAKSPFLGVSFREPLGLAASIALADMKQRGKLPDLPTFYCYEHAVYPNIKDRIEQIKKDLMKPQTLEAEWVN